MRNIMKWLWLQLSFKSISILKLLRDEARSQQWRQRSNHTLRWIFIWIFVLLYSFEIMNFIMLKFSLFQNGNKIVSNEEGRDQKWSSCLIFKLQVGGPNRPIQVKALNFHTQSVHSLTLQLLPIGKNYNNIANFFCAFFRSETFLLSISIAFAASRPSSNYVLFSSKEKVFEKLWIAWWKRFPCVVSSSIISRRRTTTTTIYST